MFFIRRFLKKKKLNNNYDGDIFDPQRFRPENGENFEIDNAPTPYVQHPATSSMAGSSAGGMAGVGAAAAMASIPPSSTQPPSAHSGSTNQPIGTANGANNVKRPLQPSQTSAVNVHADAGRYAVQNEDPDNLRSDIPPTYDSISR